MTKIVAFCLILAALVMQKGSPKYHIDQITEAYNEVKKYQEENAQDVHIPTSQGFKRRQREAEKDGNRGA